MSTPSTPVPPADGPDQTAGAGAPVPPATAPAAEAPLPPAQAPAQPPAPPAPLPPPEAPAEAPAPYTAQAAAQPPAEHPAQPPAPQAQPAPPTAPAATPVYTAQAAAQPSAEHPAQPPAQPAQPAQADGPAYAAQAAKVPAQPPAPQAQPATAPAGAAAPYAAAPAAQATAPYAAAPAAQATAPYAAAPAAQAAAPYAPATAQAYGVPAQAGPVTPAAQPPAYTSPIPVRATHLGHAIGSEWTKIWSVRSTVWTLVVMFVVTVGIATLVALAVSSSDEQSMEPTAPGFIGILLGHIAILTFGVLVMSTEYTTGMIRTTLTASPQRGRLLVAKSLVFAVITFVATAAALGLSFVLSQAIVGDTFASARMPDDAWVDAILGVSLYVTLLGLLGVAMATLLRSSAGSITMMLGVVLLPTIGGSFLYISENLHDLADKVQDFSAIGAMSSLSMSYGGDEFNYSGWPQTALLAAVTLTALIGAYARLSSSDA
jgi:ABC-type transport system involved in multi-copper enzyme maturation permease subunit